MLSCKNTQKTLFVCGSHKSSMNCELVYDCYECEFETQPAANWSGGRWCSETGVRVFCFVLRAKTNWCELTFKTKAEVSPSCHPSLSGTSLSCLHSHLAPKLVSCHGTESFLLVYASTSFFSLGAGINKHHTRTFPEKEQGRHDTSRYTIGSLGSHGLFPFQRNVSATIKGINQSKSRSLNRQYWREIASFLLDTLGVEFQCQIDLLQVCCC